MQNTGKRKCIHCRQLQQQAPFPFEQTAQPTSIHSYQPSTGTLIFVAWQSIFPKLSDRDAHLFLHLVVWWGYLFLNQLLQEFVHEK